MKLVYIAGPYRSETRQGCSRNIEAALQMARLVVPLGWMPVTPHSLTPLFDWDYPNLANDSFWLMGTLEVLRRCDAVLLLPGWENSLGTIAELEEAKRLNIPVAIQLSELKNFNPKK